MLIKPSSVFEDLRLTPSRDCTFQNETADIHIKYTDKHQVNIHGLNTHPENRTKQEIMYEAGNHWTRPLGIDGAVYTEQECNVQAEERDT